MYCKGAGAAAESCTGAEECVVGSTTPVRRGGGGATGARPAEVYCKGAGAAAEYCTGAEECVVGSTTPVRRGGRSYRGEARVSVLQGSRGRSRVLYGGGGVCGGVHNTRPSGGAELQGRGPRECTVKEQGPQQSTVRERRSVWWGPQHPSVGGGRSYRGEALGIRPWVETQVCKVTINCGYRCGRDRVGHLLKCRGRAISAIRYSVGARVYLPVLPSIMIRAPRMVAVRGPEDEWREGRVLLP